jgi:hypothetical protein
MTEPTALARSLNQAFLGAAGICGRTAELLLLSKEDPKSFCMGFGLGLTITISPGGVACKPMEAADPSTIFASLPVRRPRDPSTVPTPSYYPSYVGLSPEQRWVYLSWLRDVTQPVDIGYVFIYYYGLERHLIYGAYDIAFEELLELRRHHSNLSFQSYSRCALVCSSMLHQRRDNLARLYADTAQPECIDNYDLLVAHQARMALSVSGLIQTARRIPKLNKRYIKEQPKLMHDMLTAVLIESFQTEAFPFFSLYNIEDLPKRPALTFSNISFPPEVRSQALPDFFAHQAFVNDISAIYLQAHERTKAFLAQQRKANRAAGPHLAI